MNFDSLEKGFYPVEDDGEWSVMFWDGKEFYDTSSGSYSSCDHTKYIQAVGERIELPPKYKKCADCGNRVGRVNWVQMGRREDGMEICRNCFSNHSVMEY